MTSKILGSITIPNDLRKWDINLINKLITILSIEGDSFDFKSKEGLKDDLLDDICGMANISGGFIVIGIEEIKSGQIITGFKKDGFSKGLEDEIQKKITNYIYEVEPTPLVEFITINDDVTRTFYPIINIISEEQKKPYFKKNGQCYIRVGSSSRAAQRSLILHYLRHHIISRDELLNHTKYINNIFKQMIGLTFSEKSLYYLSLVVPKDYGEFGQRLVDINKNIEYIEIKDIKHYDWAISHLHDRKYENIFNSYDEFEAEVIKYNKLMFSIWTYLKQRIKKDFEKMLKGFKNDDDLSFYNCYSSTNLINKLLLLLHPKKNDEEPVFETLVKKTKLNDSYYLEILTLNFLKMTSENVDPSLIIEILNSIKTDKILKNRLNRIKKQFEKIYTLQRAFNNKIQLLTEDLDGGDSLKGFCKVGY
jgi:hypothetical protein